MSNARTGVRSRRQLIALASAATLAVGMLGGGASSTATAAPTNQTTAEPGLEAPATYKGGNYVVVMAGEPAVVYDGGIKGYGRTAPTGRSTYDATSTQAKRYESLLRTRQDRTAASVGAAPYYHYTAALNGFAADLSGQQAAKLAHKPGVIAVVKDEKQQLDTWNTPSMLGLSGSAGVWRRLGGPSSADGAGKGTIIGVVDTGIDSDSASFEGSGGPVPAQWNGICQQADEATPEAQFDCNDKLIGGRYFAEGYGSIYEGEFLSPEDFGGHGSHTASTAAGNNGVRAIVEDTDFGLVSGMAPAAKVASYKVCWEEEDPDAGGCYPSDSVAAIDAAVKDGVDVINFSISGTLENPVDPVELAFMYAADANVFVAASAGNSGPDASTVAHPSPWVTTVAAATHFLLESTATLGDGQEFVGASSADADVPATPLVDATDIPADGVDPADSALCLPDSIDTAAADGAIVLCDRGSNARTEKSAVVEEAGGVAMLFTNVPGGADDTAAELHSVPTIHLRAEYHAAIHAYAATDGATASFGAGDNSGSATTPPPAISSFSSRGPALIADGDLLKPDITAPGSDVLAAVTPERNSGRSFDLYSGTSMSSPHIAGLALLFRQKHPGWSPMAIKSAMMTTAKNLKGDKSQFGQGAGFVVPRKFFSPGLVFDSDWDDWMTYLAGQGVTVGGEPIWDVAKKASNTNTPSIALNNLAGSETVTREVTNVDDKAATYKVRNRQLDGVTMKATPSKFTIAPGATQKVTLTFTRSGAALNKYSTGYVVMRDGMHTVRIPVVAAPTAFEAPSELTVGTSRKVTTTSGIAATIRPKTNGLVAGVDHAATAGNTDQRDFDPNDPANYLKMVKTGAKTQMFRVSTIPQFEGDDLDLFVFDPDGNFVGQSAVGGSDETVTVLGTKPGAYYVFVQAWSTHGNVDETSFDLRTFKVGSKSRKNFTIAPKKQQATVGGKNKWTLKTSGLTSGTPYLGLVNWDSVSAKGKRRTRAQTVVSVQP